jgi:hypothetical protein
VDPTGHWVESALDVIGFGLSLRDFRRDPSLGNAFWLGLDVVGLALPVVTFAWARHADEVASVARHADDVSTAYLLGGRPDGRRGIEQIVELSNQYSKVVVNDILPHSDAMTKNWVEQAGYKLSNVSYHVGDAAKLPRLNHTDIFIVGPDIGFENSIVKVANRVLGDGSTLIVASNLGKSSERLSIALRAGGLNVTEGVFRAGDTIVQVGSRKVKLTSVHFDRPGRFVGGQGPFNTLFFVTQ